jgi:hypothetical protein
MNRSLSLFSAVIVSQIAYKFITDFQKNRRFLQKPQKNVCCTLQITYPKMQINCSTEPRITKRWNTPCI